MSGNVWEWCQDWYQDSYNGLGSADPSGPASGSERVFRGGGWYYVASYCRSAYRYRSWPSNSFSFLGFRVVLAVPLDASPPTDAARVNLVSPAVGSERVVADNVLGMAFVEVTPGSFPMGSNDGSPKTKPVRITKGFWMGKTEVTQAQWRQLMNDTPSSFKGDDLPVECVSWDRCVAFCRTLTERERTAGRLPAGYVYRLPTEAEWEYAACGGSKSRDFTYSGGNDLGTVGWFKDNSGSTTHPVGKKAANELGLHDMSGNVWEWCQDWYQDSYNGLGSADPSGPATGSYRVGRGGSWLGDASNCRSADRYMFRPSYTGVFLGFRVVLAVPLDTGPAADAARVNLVSPAIGSERVVADNVLGMAFVEVAAGSFTMGSNDGEANEKPVRTVRITKGFWMGKTEVTQAQWRQLMNDSPSRFKGDDLPVEQVDWNRCVEFCGKLTERERTAGRLPAGYVYRLPTEAEWEYAARGGSKSRGFTYSGGNDLGTVGWFTDNSGGTTHPVGKKTANELGLYDLSGNVWEWCQDWYQDSYNGLGSADPSGPATGSDRVNRGGCWSGDASFCRSAFRNGFRPSYTLSYLGFRVVLTPVP
jgi:formylglycine-generating enzyme required for sulfatase activity